MWYLLVETIGENGDLQVGIRFAMFADKLTMPNVVIIGPFVSHAVALAHIHSGT
jgi:hypothetical protein